MRFSLYLENTKRQRLIKVILIGTMPSEFLFVVAYQILRLNFAIFRGIIYQTMDFHFIKSKS